MVKSVIVRTWEHEPSVYQLQAGIAILISGSDVGPVDLSGADGELVGLKARCYTRRDGASYLAALLATYKGSRMRAERYEFATKTRPPARPNSP